MFRTRLQLAKSQLSAKIYCTIPWQKGIMWDSCAVVPRVTAREIGYGVRVRWNDTRMLRCFDGYQSISRGVLLFVSLFYSDMWEFTQGRRVGCVGDGSETEFPPESGWQLFNVHSGLKWFFQTESRRQFVGQSSADLQSMVCLFNFFPKPLLVLQEVSTLVIPNISLSLFLWHIIFGHFGLILQNLSFT